MKMQCSDYFSLSPILSTLSHEKRSYWRNEINTEFLISIRIFLIFWTTNFESFFGNLYTNIYWELYAKFLNLTAFNKNKSNKDKSKSLTLFRMGIFGATHRWGGGATKRPPSLNSVAHILQGWNLAQLFLT